MGDARATIVSSCMRYSSNPVCKCLQGNKEMTFRLFAVFTNFPVLLIALLFLCGPPATLAADKDEVRCFVLVTFDWQKHLSNKGWSFERTKVSQKLLFDTVQTLVSERRKEGELAFPFDGVVFGWDYAIFNMAPDCTRARELVAALFEEYYLKLDYSELEDSPDIRVAEKLATKYQALCGIHASADSCPNADLVYP